MTTLETILLIQTISFSLLALFVIIVAIYLIQVLQKAKGILQKIEDAAQDVKRIRYDVTSGFWGVIANILNRRR